MAAESVPLRGLWPIERTRPPMCWATRSTPAVSSRRCRPDRSPSPSSRRPTNVVRDARALPEDEG